MGKGMSYCIGRMGAAKHRSGDRERVFSTITND